MGRLRVVKASLLGSYTIPAGQMVFNPTSAGAQGGPRYSWTTAFAEGWNSDDHIVLDSVGVGVPISISIVPEPGSLTLLALGAVGLLIWARCRHA